MVDEEWLLMGKGLSSPRAAALNEEITKSVDSFQPSTNPEQALYSQALQRAHELNQDRTLRLLYASEGLPSILWIVLGVLAATIILFTYLLGMESALLHIVAVAVLTASLSFTMFATITQDRPFGGDLRVGPDSFEIVLDEIEGDSQLEA